jgi:hypothetical protein
MQVSTDMTSDVMASTRGRGHAGPTNDKPMNNRLVATIVLVPFLAYSLWVAATCGPIGFLELAGREPWAAQLLIDLVITSAFSVHWMVRDARVTGRNPWPFVVATLAVGSVAALVYIVTGRGKRA